MARLAVLRKRYMRARRLYPSVARIEAWMPESLCLDSRPDAERLARMYKRDFSPRVTTEGIFQKLAHLSYCTDNRVERRKIAYVLARLL